MSETFQAMLVDILQQSMDLNNKYKCTCKWKTPLCFNNVCLVHSLRFQVNNQNKTEGEFTLVTSTKITLLLLTCVLLKDLKHVIET